MTCFGHWYNPKYPETSARCVSHLSSKQFAAKWKNRFFPWTFFALKTKGFQIVKGMWKRRIQRHGIQTWYASVSCQQSAPRDSSRSNEMTAKWLRWFFCWLWELFWHDDMWDHFSNSQSVWKLDRLNPQKNRIICASHRGKPSCQ